MLIETHRRSSSKDDSSLIIQNLTHDLSNQLLPLGYSHNYRFTSEQDGDDYKDTDPELSIMIKRPVIITEDKL